MSKKHFPAAVEVSFGCSVAPRLATLAFNARTISCKSPIDLATVLALPPKCAEDGQRRPGVRVSASGFPLAC
jgi:hypothetical protein